MTVGLVIAVVACGGSADRSPANGPAGTPVLSVADVLAGDAGSTEAYARAVEPRPFAFPEDHGPHPAFRTEWWYFTGNLESTEGERIGYQLTFFRNALAPPDAATPAADERASLWATRQAWLAHFAVTDASREAFYADERLVRGGRVALAGAAVAGSAFRVRVADWSARPATHRPVAGRAPETRDEALGPVRITARQADAAVDLLLEPLKSPVLQGDDGLSKKGGGPGNASYYYSFTRLRTTGSVRVGGRNLEVSGLSWMDREWSTSALAENQVGWDWFALQLDDGRELMLYLLRLDPERAPPGREVDPASSGTLVAADGSFRRLERGDFAVRVLDRWRSPRGGTVYPSGWRVEVPAADLDLEVRPVIPDQELDVGFRYWEGAVDVRGSAGRRIVGGRGYVELTGYADRAGRDGRGSGEQGGASGKTRAPSARTD